MNDVQHFIINNQIQRYNLTFKNIVRATETAQYVKSPATTPVHRSSTLGTNSVEERASSHKQDSDFYGTCTHRHTHTQ